MELVTINSNKYPSSYDQPSDDIIKWPLLKSPEKYSHASQFTKHISFMPPTKTSCPPDFCNYFPPFDPLKMMTANIGLFDVSFISSIFIAFSQIALLPT